MKFAFKLVAAIINTLFAEPSPVLTEARTKAYSRHGAPL